DLPTLVKYAEFCSMSRATSLRAKSSKLDILSVAPPIDAREFRAEPLFLAILGNNLEERPKVLPVDVFGGVVVNPEEVGEGVGARSDSLLPLSECLGPDNSV